LRLRSKEKAILIANGKAIETTNFVRKREFIIAFGKAYPLETIKELTDLKTGQKVYLIIEDKIPEPVLDSLQRLVVKEEVANITKALLWYTSRPLQTLIAVAIAGVFAGTYLQQMTEKFFEWLKSLPAETVGSVTQTLNLALMIVLMAIPIVTVILRKKQ